jgi:tRNA pseudouridine38-40 synthase
VISFHAPRLAAATWQRALNALLPEDIAIRAARVVPDDFRARWSALARSYRYRILVDAVRSPLRERYVWRIPGPLDVAAMATAADVLRGEHDFGAFGSSPRDQPKLGIRGHTVRTLLAVRCGWSETEPNEVECDFTANGFLSGMVRRLVGTLVLVGAGRLTVAAFRSIVEARDKAHPGAAAPARGLCLTGVTYPTGLLDWTETIYRP